MTKPRPDIKLVTLGKSNLVTFIDAPEYWLHLSPQGSITGAHLIDGLFEAPGESPIPAVVKLASDPTAREHLRAEYAAYRYLAELADDLPLDDPAYPAVPRMLGYRKMDNQDVLVLERALVSLDRFVARDPRAIGDEAVPREILVQLTREFATLAAAAVLRTLTALESRAGRSAKLAAHRDIRLENLLVVERNGAVDVVLADWATAADSTIEAPEQRSQRISDTTTDLWGLALALWELMHSGETPYRVGDDGPYVRRGDVRLGRGRPGLVLDVTSCDSNDACLCGPGMDPAHILAAGILSAGDDRAARRGVLSGADVFGALEDLRDRILADAEVLRSAGSGALARRRPAETLLRRLYFADVARASSFDQGWLPAAPASVADFEFSPHFERPGIRIRTRLKRLFTVKSLLAAIAQLSAGAGIAAIATVLAFIQRVNIPTNLTELAQALITSTFAIAIAIVLLIWSLILRRAVPRRERTPPWMTWPPLTALAGIATSWLVGAHATGSDVMQLPDQPALTLAPRLVIAVAAGLLASCVNGFVVCWVDHNLTMRRRLRDSVRTRGLVAALSAVVAAALVLVTFTPALPASDLAAASVTTIASGMPEGSPAFANPDDLAVAKDGTVAVLERYADLADVVWMRSPAGIWTEALRVTAQRAPAVSREQDAVTEGIVDTADFLGSRMGHALSSTPVGDSLTAIGAMDFLPTGQLAVLGPEGVSVVTFGGLHPNVSNLVDVPRVDRFSRAGELRVAEGNIYLAHYDTDVFADARPDVIDRWTDYPMCADTGGAARPSAPKVIRVSFDGSISFPLWTEDGESCVRDVFTVAVSSSAPRFVEWSYAGGKWAAWVRSIDGSIEPFDMAQGYGFSVYTPVISGDRLLTVTGSCILGYALDPDAELPAVVERTWYTPTSTQKCTENADYGGFIGGQIKPTTVAESRDGNDSSPDDAGYSKPSCEPPTSGRKNLDFDEWKQKPMALGADGTVYVIADAGYQCTPILWTLGPADTEWTPLAGHIAISEQGGADLKGATMMMASEPSVVDKVPTWKVEGRWRLVNAMGAGRSPVSGPTNSYRALSSAEAFVADGIATVSVPYENYIPAFARTKLTVSPNEGSAWEVLIPNATGVSAIPDAAEGDDTIVLGLCGSIVSFNTAFTPTEFLDPESKGYRWVIPDKTAFHLVAGILDEEENPAAPLDSTPDSCTKETSEAPRDAHSDSEVPLFPSTMDVARTASGLVVAYGEVATFNGTAVSRVRVIDTSPDAKETIRTVGCVDDDPEYDGTCAGDLASLGLEPFDVAIRPDGTIAVATISSTGAGPVLILTPDGRRQILRTDARILASGVVWNGDTLIVTDSARGDVLAYTLAADRSKD